MTNTTTTATEVQTFHAKDGTFMQMKTVTETDTFTFGTTTVTTVFMRGSGNAEGEWVKMARHFDSN